MITYELARELPKLDEIYLPDTKMAHIYKAKLKGYS